MVEKIRCLGCEKETIDELKAYEDLVKGAKGRRWKKLVTHVFLLLCETWFCLNLGESKGSFTHSLRAPPGV